MRCVNRALMIGLVWCIACPGALQADSPTVLWGGGIFGAGNQAHGDSLEFRDGGRAPSFDLDVGTAQDSNASNPIYLQLGTGVSGILVNGSRTYRNLSENSYIYFFVRTDGLQLAPNGVPYRDAILTIVYQDTVDELDCSDLGSTRSSSRDFLQVRLDYGNLSWHTLAGIGGCADSAWKNATVFLENNPWQTLRSIDGLFQFRIFNRKEMSTGLPLPIDRIGLTFVDRERLESERELERAARGYVRVDFNETTTIDQSDYLGKYVVFVRNYLEKVYPNSVPDASEIIDRIDTFEVRGELEPVSFGIYAFEDLDDVRVNVSPLVNGSGRGPAIPAASIDVEKVVCIDKKWGYAYSKYYGTNPWYLDRFDALDIPAGTSQQVWLTIHVPENIPAGTYDGTITVSGGAIETRTIALSMRVYDIGLDSPAVVPYVYHSPYLPSKYYSNPKNISARDMADHGIYPLPYVTATMDKNLTIDFKDMPAEFQALKDIGILADYTRVIVTDNWRSLWYWTYGNYSYLQGDTTLFDQKYKQVLAKYRAFFQSFGTEPDLSFNDEPGTNPELRAAANHLNRLAKELGMRTWVTYYDNCEKPLAGYVLTFSDQSSGLTRTPPDWLKRDAGLQAYWDFEGDATDKSPNSNDGTFHGKARASGGEAVFENESTDYMSVPDDPSLDLTDGATIYLWFKPAAYTSTYARQPLRKWTSTADADYVLYYFGNYSGVYPDYQGRVGYYANISGTWTTASGYSNLRALDSWYNLIWVFDAGTGGTLYLNGQPLKRSVKGNLTSNSASLFLGSFNGSMDEVMILDRALTEEEVTSAIMASSGDYDTSQAMRLCATIPAGEQVPKCFNLSVVDNTMAADALETVKVLKVNGQVAWARTAVHERGFETYHIDISPFVKQGQANQFELEFRNNYSRSENLTVYIVDAFFRNQNWTAGAGANWNCTNLRDDCGDLGPMDPFLDDRVYAMRYVSSEQANMTREANDRFSYYTTYPATQAVAMYNRFLMGVYGSATNASTINVYAYGDWGEQPYDDMWQGYNERMTTASGRLGQNCYELALPSWDREMLDTIAWESLREGIEDSRVIATLLRAMGENSVPESAEARAYLDDLLSRPNRNYSPSYMEDRIGEPMEKYSDRSADMLADLAGDPGDFGFFDRMRMTMLDFIVRITGNHAPAINITNLTGNVIILEDEPYLLHPNATDIDASKDVLTWAVDTDAAFLELESATGRLAGIPRNEHVGKYSVNISVSDGRGGADCFNFSLEVQNVNDPPEITTSGITVCEQDRPYSVDFDATDMDPTNDTLAWSFVTNATFLELDGASGVLSGVPGNPDVGEYSVNVSVSDGNGGGDWCNFTLTVENVNDAPFVRSHPADARMDEDTVDYVLDLTDWFGDIDGDALSFRCEGNGSIAVAVAEDGIARLGPAADWSGNQTIRFFARDAQYEVGDTVNITVLQVNDAPTGARITLEERDYCVNGSQPASGEAEDADLPYGDVLTFTWYSNVTGLIGEGVAINLSLPAGNHTLTLKVTDICGAQARATANITILDTSNETEPPPVPVQPVALPTTNIDTGKGFQIGIAVIVIACIVVVAVARSRRKQGPVEREGPKDGKAEEPDCPGPKECSEKR